MQVILVSAINHRGSEEDSTPVSGQHRGEELLKVTWPGSWVLGPGSWAPSIKPLCANGVKESVHLEAEGSECGHHCSHMVRGGWGGMRLGGTHLLLRGPVKRVKPPPSQPSAPRRGRH